jgi:hypothetical protein
LSIHPDVSTKKAVRCAFSNPNLATLIGDTGVAKKAVDKVPFLGFLCGEGQGFELIQPVVIRGGMAA